MRRMGGSVLLLLLALLAAGSLGQVDWARECISECKCIWVSGKKTAECRRQNLTSVPNSLSSEIQILDLTGNPINHLSDKAFSHVRLVNLQKLVLRDCTVKSVSAQAFHGLRIVIEIDLSGNKIRQLHRGTFDETERLRVLLLNQNRLQRLDDELFHDLKFLQKVELSDNHLTQVAQWSFRNLPGLQSLTLDGNNLTRLSVHSFEQLPRLGSLELRRNPWLCDCHLKPFRDWAMQQKLYTRPTSCEEPVALAGRAWDEVAPDEFACAPQIQQMGAAQSGSGAHLWCQATGSPRPQITWMFRQRVLANGTKRHAPDRGYVLQRAGDWANLTIPDLTVTDRGDYVCVANNFGGSEERNVSLQVTADGLAGRDSLIGLPLALGLGLLALLFLVVALALCLCYCRRRRSHRDEKSAEAASLDQHGLGEQEKSLITAINPVVKPPRRYEAPSVASHGTEMTELNRTLLDNDSVFADGVGSVVGVLANGLHEEERGRATPELEAVMGGVGMMNMVGGLGGSVMSGIGTLSRNATPYRQYPPDLLAFSGGRNSSPTSQASTAPDSSRLPPGQGFGSPSSPASVVAAYGPFGFKTLPHPARASSATPYSMGHHHPAMPRHGYVTIPRRPRAPSWSSGPTSPIDRDTPEPVYDNLGRRTTADGSLRKSPEHGMSMRNRPLPSTPSEPGTPTSPGRGVLTLPRVRRPPPPVLQLNRSAPEGAAEWPMTLVDEMHKPTVIEEPEEEAEKQPAAATTTTTTTTPATMVKTATPTTTVVNGQSPGARKVPPRPPPKPKKKNPNGPLYEDEGEDGTEV